MMPIVAQKKFKAVNFNGKLSCCRLPVSCVVVQSFLAGGEFWSKKWRNHGLRNQEHKPMRNVHGRNRSQLLDCAKFLLNGSSSILRAKSKFKYSPVLSMYGRLISARHHECVNTIEIYICHRKNLDICNIHNNQCV